jgi:glutathione S-transferase
MIVVHHLNNSRSQRILWLLEELGTPYEIKAYQRDATTRLAPPELKAVHPLGKSPVITDGGATVAESGAIIEYLIDHHGGGRFKPGPGGQDALDYLHFMHFAEGSAMLPILLAMYVSRLGAAGAPLHPRIFSEIDNHLAYMEGALADRQTFVKSGFSAADVQMTFVVEAANATGRLAAYPRLSDYLARMQARPAYVRAIERGGPYSLGA